MTPAEIHQKLVDRFQGKITGVQLETLDPWVEVAPEAILEVAEFLKFDPDFSFDSLANLSGVDYCEPDPKKVAKYGHEPHVEVVYHLFSFKHRHRIVVKVRLPRWKNDQAGQIPDISSVSSVWSIADWHERETFDLVGINFLGHPNLKRILCAEDWEGHPLRKDYDFPLEYHGVRVR